MNFKGKTIWITGASSGIGRALAIAFSRHPVRLILSSRNEDKLEETRMLCDVPDKVRVLPLDLAKTDTLKERAEKAIDCFGGVDILVHNGGISQRSLAAGTSLEVDRKIFETNYFGTVCLTRSLLPHFMEKKSGQFVVITSVVGRIGTPMRSSYSASKHALHGFFDSLRAEVHRDNIKVTLICPGFVNTDVSVNALTGDGSRQGTMDKATADGLSPQVFARKALRVISAGKQEAVIGGSLEVLAVYVKRFFPLLLSRMIRKVDVT